MFAKINGNVVQKYPYTLEDLRRENPNISFPANPNTDVLQQLNVVKVTSTAKPSFTSTQLIQEKKPELINGVWTQVWEVINFTNEQIADLSEQKASAVREERNNLLFASDWTQLNDTPLAIKQQWVSYRQALRDISLQENFPHDVVWPVAPLD